MWLDRNELVSLDLKLTSDYGDIIPKIQIGYDLFNLIEHNTSIDTETKINLKEKAVICHQKIKMMLFAEKCAIENLNEFEVSQNMEMPCLFGDDETTLLYHTESTILFARNALDVVATIFHCIAFHERNDSFNKFTKKILKDENDKFIYLKSYLCEIDKLDTHAFRLLCGSERGRSLRDQIVHQTNIKLEYDAVIQGAPAVSAGAADISTADILSKGRPLFWIMGLTCVCSAFLLNRVTITGKRKTEKNNEKSNEKNNERNLNLKWNQDQQLETAGELEKAEGVEKGAKSGKKTYSRTAMILAILTPVAFLMDILFMILFKLKGGDATSLVAGTAVLLMCAGTVMEFKVGSLEKVTEYVTDGFLFAIRIFAPVIVIGAFFFLGGNGIIHILGDSYERGILNDWALWLAHHAPLNRYMTALLQLVIGGLTGLDGSGFSGLPLTGALARTFGTATGASIPVLACLGQISAIFIGGGTVVPWGLIPVAAICNVDPVELARKNMLPVFIGLTCTFLAACLVL